MQKSVEDPGAVLFGNFINYYQFNTPEERLSVFPQHLWNNNWESQDGKLLVLDVGCNAGNFTQLFHTFISKHSGRDVFILGIDIDPTLIQRATESNAFPEKITYATLDFMTDTGYLDDFLLFHKRKSFDVVLGLSITMWIHLNHGDDGLKTFLMRLSSLTDILVTEPQPWKCYQTAVRRMSKVKKKFPHFRDLTWRSGVDGDINNYLETQCQLRKIFESTETKWKRKILCYRKQK